MATPATQTVFALAGDGLWHIAIATFPDASGTMCGLLRMATKYFCTGTPALYGFDRPRLCPTCLEGVAC